MSDDIDKIRQLKKELEKNKPDVNEKYELFPNRGDDGFVQRVGNPTYALQVQVDKVRINSVTVPKAVREEICTEYGWEQKKPELHRLDYYKEMLPLVVMGDVDVKDDFSTMEADRLIKDFLMCTYA